MFLCFYAGTFFVSWTLFQIPEVKKNMPNAKVLGEKQAVVAELAEKLKGASGVLVDYSGITVAEDTEMRAKLRKANVDYAVIKNTLLRFAANNAGYEGLDPILNGTTSLAVHLTDPVAPAKLIKEYATKFTNHFEIKGGFMNGKVLTVDEVNALASIPALPVLQAMLLGTMQAPITSLAVVLKAAAEKLGGGVSAEATAEVPVEAAVEAPAEAPVEAPAE